MQSLSPPLGPTTMLSPTSAIRALPLWDEQSTAYVTWRRRRVNFDPKVSATMPRPTPAMITPPARSLPTPKRQQLHPGDDTSEFFSSASMLDDSHWVPKWLREEHHNSSSNSRNANGNNDGGDGTGRSAAVHHNNDNSRNVSQSRGVSTLSSGACSSVLPGEGGPHDPSSKKAQTIDDLVNSPMIFTRKLLDLHDELRDVEASCHNLVKRAMELDPKTSVAEILEGSSELSYHSIKVDAVDGEIRRIQREITGTFSVLDGAIIHGSESMPAEKSTMLLNSLRACIPEVRSSIRLAETRLTSLLM